MTPPDGTAGAESDRVRIYSVVTPFQRAALRPGGITREQAIEEADAALERLKPEFDEWIDSEIEALRRELPSPDERASDPGWPSAASLHCERLRDVGATAGYELLSFVASSMCEILGTDEASTPRAIESLQCHFDALQLVCNPQYYRLPSREVPELKNGLLRVLARIQTAGDSDD